MQPYYEHDGVTIYHGDCREVETWLVGDIMVTDPPYGIAWKRSENKARSSRAHGGIQGDDTTALRDEVLRRWGDRPALVFGSLYAPHPSGVKHILVWHKPADAGVVGSTIGYRRDIEAVYLIGRFPAVPSAWSSVLRSLLPNIGSPHSPAGRTGHPHAKPVDLISVLMQRAPIGMVADPFMGSGTTLVAAKGLGRNAIGIEIEERYCEIAAERLSQGVLDFASTAPS